MTERAAAEARAREIARDMTSLAIKGRTGVRVWSTEKNQRRAAMLTAYFEKALLAARAEAIEECARVADKMGEDSCPHLIDESCCLDSLRKIAAAIRALGPATEGEGK